MFSEQRNVLSVFSTGKGPNGVEGQQSRLPRGTTQEQNLEEHPRIRVDVC